MMIKRALERFRYLIVLFSTTNPSFPYILLLGTAILVVLVGMAAYFFGLFSLQSIRASGIQAEVDAGFFDSLWWSVKHVLDPGAFSENYGAPATITFFALFNTLMGLVITGALIGFIVNFIQSRMDEMKGGIRQIRERNHTLILGWNRKGVSILKLLAEMKIQKPVVILSPTEVSRVSQNIDKEKKCFLGMRILPQLGSPSILADLERVGIQDCESIIILANTELGNRAVSPDIETVKTLMLLETIEWNKNKPQTVIEVFDQANSKIIKIAAGKKTPIVSSTEFVSKTMVQCARHPGYAEAYRKIFSFEGNKALNFVSLDETERGIFGDLAMRYDRATAIGVSWIESINGEDIRKAILNPEPTYDLADDEDIILLGDSDFEILDQTLSQHSEANVSPKNSINTTLKSVMIIGSNSNLLPILEELSSHAKIKLKVDLLISNHQNFPDPAKQIDNLDIRLIVSEKSMEKMLNNSNLSEYDVVFILADDMSSDPDAQTILTLLLLKEIRRMTSRKQFPRIIAEFYDESSKQLCLDTPLTDAVVSTNFVSMQLAHMSREPVLYSIYKELLSAGGIEICFRPISRYGLNQKTYDFATLRHAVQRTHEIAMGVKKSDGLLEINPSNERNYDYSMDDMVVVLAQQLYGQ